MTTLNYHRMNEIRLSSPEMVLLRNGSAVRFAGCAPPYSKGDSLKHLANKKCQSKKIITSSLKSDLPWKTLTATLLQSPAPSTTLDNNEEERTPVSASGKQLLLRSQSIEVRDGCTQDTSVCKGLRHELESGDAYGEEEEDGFPNLASIYRTEPNGTGDLYGSLKRASPVFDSDDEDDYIYHERDAKRRWTEEVGSNDISNLSRTALFLGARLKSVDNMYVIRYSAK